MACEFVKYPTLRVAGVSEGSVAAGFVRGVVADSSPSRDLLVEGVLAVDLVCGDGIEGAGSGVRVGLVRAHLEMLGCLKSVRDFLQCLSAMLTCRLPASGLGF